MTEDRSGALHLVVRAGLGEAPGAGRRTRLATTADFPGSRKRASGKSIAVVHTSAAEHVASQKSFLLTNWRCRA